MNDLQSPIRTVWCQSLSDAFALTPARQRTGEMLRLLDAMTWPAMIAVEEAGHPSEGRL